MMEWLFGHAYAWIVIGLFFVAGISTLAIYHCWILPKARQLAEAGSPEGYKALVGLWKTMYPAAACNLLVALIGIIYHSHV